MQNTFDFISSLLARWLAGIPDTVDYCVYYYMRLEHTHRTKTNEEWFHLLHSLFVWCTNENIFLLTSLTMRRVKQKNNNNLYLFHTDIEFCPILSDQCTHLRDIPSRIVVLCRRCRYRRRSYVRTIRSSFYFFCFLSLLLYFFVHISQNGTPTRWHFRRTFVHVYMRLFSRPVASITSCIHIDS